MLDFDAAGFTAPAKLLLLFFLNQNAGEPFEMFLTFLFILVAL
jgi:hypothetical protein